jgi:hypothetical protein
MKAVDETAIEKDNRTKLQWAQRVLSKTRRKRTEGEGGGLV